MNKEEFDSYAYVYRSWPSSDPAGVVERFNELTEYVESLIAAERTRVDSKPVLNRTELGDKLLAIKQRAIENGIELLTMDEINDIVAKERRTDAYGSE